jgi:hypothetical protein
VCHPRQRVADYARGTIHTAEAVFGGQHIVGSARRAADRAGISGFLLASLGRIDRVVLRVGEWPRGLCQFRLALRLGAAYADDESATAGDQGRRGR